MFFLESQPGWLKADSDESCHRCRNGGNQVSEEVASAVLVGCRIDEGQAGICATGAVMPNAEGGEVVAVVPCNTRHALAVDHMRSVPWDAEETRGERRRSPGAADPGLKRVTDRPARRGGLP